MRLHEVLAPRRDELLERWVSKVKERIGPAISKIEMLDHMPVFVDQLIVAVRPGVLPLPEGINDHAEEHGRQRLRLGFDVGSVVREYGFLEQAIIQMGCAGGAVIHGEDLELVSRYINDACSDAIAQYSLQRDRELARKDAEHIGFLAHEIRNAVSAVRIAFVILQRKAEVPQSKTAAALERNLGRLVDLVDGALSDSWLRAGAEPHDEVVPLQPFLGALIEDLALEAEAKQLRIETAIEPLNVHADPRLLRSAVSNLIRNAIKFNRAGGCVTVRARREHERLLIDVQDTCGGLPAGEAEHLFDPFVQKGADRTGFGFGLAIVRNAVDALNGTVRVHNLPPTGCVFTLDLPFISA